MQMGPLSCIIKCKKKMIEMFLPQIQNINKTNGINDYKLELWRNDQGYEHKCMQKPPLLNVNK
jgi:hypothetical protein